MEDIKKHFQLCTLSCDPGINCYFGASIVQHNDFIAEIYGNDKLYTIDRILPTKVRSRELMS